MENLKNQSPNQNSTVIKKLSKNSPSKKSATQKLPLLQQVNTFFTAVFFKNKQINPQLVVGLSGGLDSCVLLHVLAQLRQALPFQLSAHHVHHGLSAHADAWADFCQTYCQQLNIPLTVSKVNVNADSGLGIEATARKLRYATLLDSHADFICTAHHQDDQAETVLLQLARGAGAKGLAAMAQIDDKRKLLRPLLDTSRTDLEVYARQHQLTWVEDESNANTQFDRNFVRHALLPIFVQQFPAIKQTLARTAQHLAEADSLLDDLAAQDARDCLTSDPQKLALTPLMHLNTARINNVLRWWLAQNQALMPSTAQLQQIAQQLLHAKSDATIKIELNSEDSDSRLTLRRYQNCAYLTSEFPSILSLDYIWQGEEKLQLANQTYLTFCQKVGQGLAIRHLNNKQLKIKNRSGSERFKPDLNRPSRSLKSVLQAAAMPPWLRTQLPLIFLDDSLVLIPNIAVDANYQAQAGEMGLIVEWHLQ